MRVHRTSSLEVYQRTPLHRLQIRESTPGMLPFLRSKRANAHSCSAPMVLHHLSGFLLPHPARILQRASGPGVHLVSNCRKAVLLAMCFCPSKLSLPPQQDKDDIAAFSIWATVTIPPLARRTVHQPPCPLVLWIELQGFALRRACVAYRTLPSDSLAAFLGLSVCLSDQPSPW